MKKLPITIGIIGHLDAIVTPQHKVVIEEIFNDIDQQYPNSPIALFSQLAIGADTVVAEMFLDIKEKSKRDYQLIVPIPFELEKFKEDFEKKDLDRYNYLRSQSEREFVLKSEPDASRNDLYRLGGQFVADSSIVLIALFDNKYIGKTGGTGDLVKYKIEGSFDNKVTEHIFDMEGALITLPCNRAKLKDKQEINLENNAFDRLIKEDASIKKTLDKIEAFNQPVSDFDEKKIDQSAAYLYPENEILSAFNEGLKRYYAGFDTQALKHQIGYVKLIKGFFIFGIIILSVFEMYKQFGLNQNVFFITVTLIGLVLLGFNFSNKWRNHEKYLENRVLAEALRIQFFWNLSNVNKSVSKHILRIHKTEFNWIKHILLAIHGITYNSEYHKKDSIEKVKKYWIDDQKIYFAKKLVELAQNKKKFRFISIAFLIVGILTLIGIFLLNQFIPKTAWIQILIVFDTILFGAFALTKAYFDKRGYKQIRNQYALMETIYSATSTKFDNILSNKRLSKKGKAEQMHQLLMLAGKESLTENGNWYMIFKDKEPAVEGLGG